MAKGLLWVFVIANFLTALLMYYSTGETDWYKDILPAWIGVAVLAICESIEKAKETNQ